MNLPLTPWGYPKSAAAKSEPKSDSNASGASWQTIRAGLLSPPPATTAILAEAILSPPPNSRVNEVEGEDAPPGPFAPPPPFAPVGMGRGGWLVDLVEGMSLEGQ